MNHAIGVLEFEKIRERLAFHCETSMGAARAAHLNPVFEASDVWDGLAKTEEAYQLLSNLAVPSMGTVRDSSESLERAAKGATLGGVELFLIAEALGALRGFRGSIEHRRQEFPCIWSLAEQFPLLKTLEDQLLNSLDGSGDIKDGASAELTRLRQRKQSATSRILERIQSYTSGRHRELLSDPIYTVRDGRYVVPVKVENRGKVRGIVHDTSGSGQTLFIEPEDVLQLGNQLREIEAAERDEVQRILLELSSKVGKNGYQIIGGIEAAGQLDFLLSKARLAFEMKATRPQRWSGSGIALQGARHPMLDPGMAVPIDISVGFEAKGLLITGPNTGGKTVAIKTVGLLVLMSQSGLFVPAIDAKLGPFTQVWADIGDEQSLQQSLSTFSAHIRNVAEALKSLKQGALVLLDEIGAGTDPAEGAALAKAILLALRDGGAYIVASTHYGELKAFAYDTPGFKNASMEFDLKSLRPTYRVLMGSPGASHALRIAERYGLPKEVTDRAYQGLSVSDQQTAKMMEQLEHAQKTARSTQGEADRRIAEARKSEERANRKLKEAEEIRIAAQAKASETIDLALREIRSEAASIFESLKSGSLDSKLASDARRRLKDLQSFGEAVAEDLRGKSNTESAVHALKKGMHVRVAGYSQPGVILEEPNGGTVLVQIGPLRVHSERARISPTEEKPAATQRHRTSLGLQRAQFASPEIHLRAKRAEEALLELEKFVDEAVLGGLPQVRIVHGKGEGILRKLTQDFLRKSPSVERFRDGENGEGGYGVTIAYLK